jgi:hypothetical protein
LVTWAVSRLASSASNSPAAWPARMEGGTDFPGVERHMAAVALDGLARQGMNGVGWRGFGHVVSCVSNKTLLVVFCWQSNNISS